jgi:hypothetical protein
MTTPQIIISLSPQGELVTELPGLNGSRRKINLKVDQKSDYAIGNAIQTLRKITNLEADTTGITNATKASELLSSLQGMIKEAAQAASTLSSLLGDDNTLSDIILRILNSQQISKHNIGEDGAPTTQQVNHWKNHGFLCEDKNCKRFQKNEIHSHSFSDPACSHCIGEGRFEKGYNRENVKSILLLSEIEALRLGLISRGFTQSKTNQEIWTKKNMGSIFLLPNGTIRDHKQIVWSKENKQKLIQDGKNYAKIHGFTPTPVFKRGGVSVKKQVKLIKETQAEKLQRKVGRLSF